MMLLPPLQLSLLLQQVLGAQLEYPHWQVQRTAPRRLTRQQR